MRRLAIATVLIVCAVSGVPAVAADGKAVYTKNCAPCHRVMSPKVGDSKAWAPLAAQGADALTAVAVKGKGAMPPKGGKPALTTDDVKAAVEYMLSQSK